MSNIGDNWTCPYCGRAQVISNERSHRDLLALYVRGWEGGKAGLFVDAVVCANDDCRKLTLGMVVFHRGHNPTDPNEVVVESVFQRWQLLPSSRAKPQPDYIPEPLRRDYEEACAIRDLSPKASATITRRCIQGIIRDFCGISKHRLVDEINELRRQVDDGRAPAGVQPDTVDAIDHVRQIGNIGAHMEADINVIVDVDADEAQVLIELAELLFDEWYVARHIRSRRLAQLGMIAAEKKERKQLPPPTE